MRPAAKGSTGCGPAFGNVLPQAASNSPNNRDQGCNRSRHHRRLSRRLTTGELALLAQQGAGRFCQISRHKHFLRNEVEALCDRIAILAHGEIRAEDTTEALLRRVKDKVLTIELASPLTAIPDVLPPFSPVLTGPQQLVFRYGRGGAVMSLAYSAPCMRQACR